MKEEGMSFLLEAKFIIYSNLLISESWVVWLADGFISFSWVHHCRVVWEIKSQKESNMRFASVLISNGRESSISRSLWLEIKIVINVLWKFHTFIYPYFIIRTLKLTFYRKVSTSCIYFVATEARVIIIKHFVIQKNVMPQWQHARKKEKITQGRISILCSREVEWP